MRVNYLIILLVLLISMIPDHSDKMRIQGSQSVKLRIISITWSGKAWDHSITDTTFLEINIGEEFGSKNAPPFFKLIDIIDDQSVKIQFTNDLVVVGEPVAYTSKQNPIIITGSTNCFRTRLFDAGTDYCIDILEINNQIE
jgi:hypothetical protein